MAEKFTDAVIELFKWLLLANPLAAIMFAGLVLAFFALRRLYGDNKELRTKYDLLLISAPLEKENALRTQQEKHDVLTGCKDKEIAVLHEQFADLSRDTTSVLRGMEHALVSGNPKKLLNSIHNGITVIGQKAHGLSPVDLGMVNSNE